MTKVNKNKKTKVYTLDEKLAYYEAKIADLQLQHQRAFHRYTMLRIQKERTKKAS